MLDLPEIAAFCAVLDSGSLTSAARQLGLPKSTMSRRIQQLEARLGQPLLRRHGHRLQVTEAGHRFEEYARQILQLSGQGLQVMADLREEISGEVTVRVHPACCHRWLIEVLEGFLADNPAVRVRLGREWQPSAAASCQEAIWLWCGPEPDCGMRYEALGALPCGLYASPEYLARQGLLTHPCELLDHPWIGELDERQGITLRHQDEGTGWFSLTPSRLRMEHPELQLGALRRGLGIGLLPRSLVVALEAEQPGWLQPCLPDWQPSPVMLGVLYPYGRQPRKVGALLNRIRHGIPAQWQRADRQAASWTSCRQDVNMTPFYGERDLINEL